MMLTMASGQPAARNGRFREVLYEALAGGDGAMLDADVLTALHGVVSGATSALAAAQHPEPESLAALRLTGLAADVDSAVARAADLFDDPSDLGEAIYLARCLGRDAASALSLLHLRDYIEAARVPEAYPDLRTDRQAVLDSTTFAALWRDPARLAWMQGIVAIWRRDYAVHYVKSHTTYNAVLAEIARMADDIDAEARALLRLNQLSRLGPPAGAAALRSLEALRRVLPCTRAPSQVNGELGAATRCGACGFTLETRATRADARLTVRAIERALRVQLARLSRRLASRIVSRPEPAGPAKLDQFLRVLRASDLQGLASVLDDSRLAFLEDLLASDPGGPEGILDELAAAFPRATQSNVEAAVAEFRRLLLARLASGGDVVELSQDAV